MLTGDKVETATNIGVATSLLDPSGLLLTYKWDSLEDTSSQAPTVKALKKATGGSHVDIPLSVSHDSSFYNSLKDSVASDSPLSRAEMLAAQ